MPSKDNRKPIRQYTHDDKKRVNNPEVGLVTPETDKDARKAKYSYDPHLDPQLQWAGKDERSDFDVSTVSLHVHERVDPRAIIERALSDTSVTHYGQGLLFESWVEKKPIREAIEFYQHDQNWTNRLIAGDSLLVMNSLLEKEGMSEKVQMIYIDPPYGIKYGSNFQPFVKKKDVKDGKDIDLSTEPEMIKAFRDTWEMGIHSYLSYLRDRIKLSYDLLNVEGSIFIQISDENVNYVRCILNEIFGPENFVSMISYSTTSGFETNTLSRSGDYVLWYAKDKTQMKFRPLFQEKEFGGEGSSAYTRLELKNGERMTISEWEKENDTKFSYKDRPEGSRVYAFDNLISQGASKEPQPFNYKGEIYNPKQGSHWKASYPIGMERLAAANRIDVNTNNSLGYIRYFDDFPYMRINNLWTDTLGQTQYGSGGKRYVVQTSLTVVERCMLMCSEEGDLVFDPTCGSGSTAFVAEKYGRRWITCDTSRVAITIAKQRLLTAYYDYYKLVSENDGVSGGFEYEKAHHIMLGDISNNRSPEEEVLYNKPITDESKHRVTGPFTVESVPAPSAVTLEESISNGDADSSITRTGETLKQEEWRDELLDKGIRGKGGQNIKFTRVEAMPGTRWIQAQGETEEGKRVLFVFGPEYAPMEQRQVEQALREAEKLRPTPNMMIFLAFQFDSEAAKDIDEMKWQDVTLLRAQMNADLFTEDLKKKRTSDDSFWLIGQPDVQITKIKSGEEKGKYQVEVRGFDYYNTKTGNVESGSSKKIAMWMLDSDYDERSLFPTQIFFPMASKKGGWNTLAKNLKAELDKEKVEAFRGTKSIPFEKGQNSQVAVKIVDDRGIESVRVLKLDK